MEISPVQDAGSSPQTPAASLDEAGQRREIIQATRTINENAALGQYQLVFMVDRATHRPIIRVEDRDTHEVMLQLPPEYVLRLAQDLGSETAHTSTSSADM